MAPPVLPTAASSRPKRATKQPDWYVPVPWKEKSVRKRRAPATGAKAAKARIRRGKRAAGDRMEVDEAPAALAGEEMDEDGDVDEDEEDAPAVPVTDRDGDVDMAGGEPASQQEEEENGEEEVHRISNRHPETDATGDGSAARSLQGDVEMTRDGDEMELGQDGDDEPAAGDNELSQAYDDLDRDSALLQQTSHDAASQPADSTPAGQAQNGDDEQAEDPAEDSRIREQSPLAGLDSWIQDDTDLQEPQHPPPADQYDPEPDVEDSIAANLDDIAQDFIRRLQEFHHRDVLSLRREMNADGCLIDLYDLHRAVVTHGKVPHPDDFKTWYDIVEGMNHRAGYERMPDQFRLGEEVSKLYMELIDPFARMGHQTAENASQDHDQQEGGINDEEDGVQDLIDDLRAHHNDETLSRQLTVGGANIDIVDLFREVEAKESFDLFSDWTTWQEIAGAIGFQPVTSTSADDVGHHLFEFYMDVVHPVRPCQEQQTFMARFTNAYRSLFQDSDRYAKRLLAFDSLARRVPICPWQLSRVLERYGGYEAVQAQGTWPNVAYAMRLDQDDEESRPILRLQTIARELLRPLGNGTAASRQNLYAMARFHDDLMAWVHRWLAENERLESALDVHGTHVDVYRLYEEVAKLGKDFKVNLDEQTWDTIANTLMVPPGAEDRGLRVRRIWRRFVNSFLRRHEHERFENIFKNSSQWREYSEGVFGKSYEKAHGRLQDPLALADLIRDFGGMLAVTVGEDIKYNWTTVVQEIWAVEPPQDWKVLADQLSALCLERLNGLIAAWTRSDVDEYKFAYEHPGAAEAQGFFDKAAKAFKSTPAAMRADGRVISGRRVCLYALEKLVEESSRDQSILPLDFWSPLARKLGLLQQPFQIEEQRAAELRKWYFEDVMDLNEPGAEDKKRYLGRLRQCTGLIKTIRHFFAENLPGLPDLESPSTLWVFKRLLEEYHKQDQAQQTGRMRVLADFHGADGNDAHVRAIFRTAVNEIEDQLKKLDQEKAAESAEAQTQHQESAKDTTQSSMTENAAHGEAPSDSTPSTSTNKRKTRDEADGQEGRDSTNKRARHDGPTMVAAPSTSSKSGGEMAAPPLPPNGPLFRRSGTPPNMYASKTASSSIVPVFSTTGWSPPASHGASNMTRTPSSARASWTQRPGASPAKSSSVKTSQSISKPAPAAHDAPREEQSLKASGTAGGQTATTSTEGRQVEENDQSQTATQAAPLNTPAQSSVSAAMPPQTTSRPSSRSGWTPINKSTQTSANATAPVLTPSNAARAITPSETAPSTNAFNPSSFGGFRQTLVRNNDEDDDEEDDDHSAFFKKVQERRRGGPDDDD